MDSDYSVHSNLLIHWTGKDLDAEYDRLWHQAHKSKTNKSCNVTGEYLKRLYNILRFGIWMTEEEIKPLILSKETVNIPKTPKCCFTELKLSESRKHARQYGRLGIGVKRPFLFKRYGRPVIYYKSDENISNDVFLKNCSTELTDKSLLNFFKPMSRSNSKKYEYYSESEWRIIFNELLLAKKIIKDPRDNKNIEEHKFFNNLSENEQNKLKYLVPLDGWLSIIIYPSLEVKNKAQQDSIHKIKDEIKRIKELNDNGNLVENNNWPIEVDLDSCRNF